MAIAYPKEFPAAEIAEIIKIIRAGELKSKALTNDLWHLQGYVMGVIIGHPEVAHARAAGPIDVVAELERLLQAHKDNTAVTFAVIPWITIAIWATKLLIEILEAINS